MIDNSVNGKPFWLDSVSVVFLLQVMGISLLLFARGEVFSVAGPILQGWRLVHVILTNVIPEHRWVEHVQLKTYTAHKI